MHNTVNNLKDIENQLNLSLEPLNITIPKIIAVSKTFPKENIMPLVDSGHIDFGENKVQEAMEKWPEIKEKFPHIKLHMLGKIQTNKVKFLFPLFDFIHSLDNLKLAQKISIEQEKRKIKPGIFIQINIGNESQKNGILIEDLKDFYNECSKNLKLNIIGLMCLPPQSGEASKYFKLMLKLKEQINLKHLSMGMSNDYLEASKYNSTYLRIGSKIFGERK
jgi:pyridoxal phosphate enzyme (YggS family)